jgi:2'-5' RNA ligase
MRLFIAINFSENVKDSICGIIERLKNSGVGGNFTRRENLHLTLVFLGEIPGKRIGTIKAAMDGIGPGTPRKIDLHFTELGSFSDILWLGIRENEALNRLQKDLSGELAMLGFRIENRRFKPHITVCRKAVLPPGFDKAALRSDIEAIRETAYRIDLIKSERIDGRLLYTPIYSTKFAAR